MEIALHVGGVKAAMAVGHQEKGADGSQGGFQLLQLLVSVKGVFVVVPVGKSAGYGPEVGDNREKNDRGEKSADEPR